MAFQKLKFWDIFRHRGSIFEKLGKKGVFDHGWNTFLATKDVGTLWVPKGGEAGELSQLEALQPIGGQAQDLEAAHAGQPILTCTTCT